MKEGQFTRKLIILVFCFLMFTPVELHAQSGRPISTVERRVETLNRHQETYEKDNMARDQKRGPTNVEATRRRQAEVEEDLYALQDAYNKILVVLHKAKDVSPEFAAASAADVKKHAARLRNNLALPKPEEEAKKAEPSAPVSSVERLKSLTRLLYSFVTNPVFENLATIDVELSRKAGKDLEGIIEIAEGLGSSK